MLEKILTGDTHAILTDVLIRVAVILISWFTIVISCLVDFWSGCSTAKALGQKLNSHGFRKTMDKIGDYFKVAVVFLLFDILGSLFAWYGLTYATIVVAFGVILIEGKSVFENAKRKKSSAAKIKDIVTEIVKAATEKDAKMIIDEISAQLSENAKNEKWETTNNQE